ncbi:DUF11 domain-containing protein [Candidatus Saccharibacteria bacterium]|nr:DUF11 domain-containing protein [Candidatus Saccharibacteria bacterium]
MNKVYKTILSVAATAIVAGATMAPASVMAWGDNAGGRDSYTLEQINSDILGDTITFNSIRDGKFGDERNFVGAKVSSDNGTVWNADEIHVEDGGVYTIRIYVHNNSLRGTDAIATGVKTTFSLPTTVASEHTVIGYIDSSNATPTRYWDEVKLVGDGDFYLEYIEGSAKYTNGKLGTVALSDSVVTSGALVGYDALDGNLPGCYGYSGMATIQVRVHASVNSKLQQKVRIKGESDWHDTVTAKVGDEVEYQIEYVNLSAAAMNNVMIRDVLPDDVEYVNDSTYLYNYYYQDGVKVVENTIHTTGINIGDYAPKGNAFIHFTGKIVNNTLGDKAANFQLVNWASATVADDKVYKDDTSVFVSVADSSDPTPTPTPTPTPEPTPTEIVSTGATEAMGVALGAGSVVTAAGYFIASRKKM